MPKIAPIVPPTAKVGKGQKKKKKKKAIADAAVAAAVSEALAKESAPESAKPQLAGNTDEGANDAAQEPVMRLLRVPASSQWVAESGLELVSTADRSDKAARFFSWLVAPLDATRFEEEVREQRPCYISGRLPGYYDGWLGHADIDAMLRSGLLRWTDDLDVVRYADGKRRTLNRSGVASAEEVWGLVGQGCSLRLSWPQRHSDRVWALLCQLEEHFCCGAGCNVYLTPPGAQGFAPHFDDVDVFILQVAGEKRWRLYAPPTGEELPRYPSADFDAADLGEPIASVTIKPGELLYLPRGCIHQAVSGGSESLHLTVSISRLHSWRDLMQA
jgi:lysine-specific demethylase/histidyl-hydroxylase NO66